MIINLKKLLKRHPFILLALFIIIFIQMLLSAIFPYLTKIILDDVLLKHQLRVLKQIILGTSALILIQIPTNIGVSYLCSKWTQLIILDLRTTISQLFINNQENVNKNGLFINTITNDCEIIGSQLLAITLNVLPNVLLTGLYLIILWQLNNQLTLIILAIIPLFLIVASITAKKVYFLSKKMQGIKDKLIEFLNSHVRNKLLIDLYHLQKAEGQDFFQVAVKVKAINIKTNTILTFLNNLSNLIAVITPLLTLFIGSIMVIHKELSLGALIAFNSYTALLFSPLSKLLTVPPMISQIKASLDRLKQIDFEEIVYHTGLYQECQLSQQLQITVTDLIPYIEKRALLKQGISCTLSKGDLLRITGPNGVGKSVLLKCLIQYHKNFTGIIQIKNKQIISYIPQENFLFAGTIKDNLTKGLLNYDNTKLQYLLALFRFELPLTQTVAPFTLSLSSGQLQKIKLIRGLLNEPDLLLLDETLANLDSTVVSNVFQYIKKHQLTTILIYHGDLNQYITASEYQTIQL